MFEYQIDDFMDYCVNKGLSKKTYKSYEKTIATARTEIWNAISAGGASHRRRWIYAALARRYSRAKSSTKR